jgi:hypothetical protein
LFTMSHFAYKSLATAGMILMMLAGVPLVRAQSGGGVVEGVVRAAGNRPMAGVKVSLDDEVEGRTLAEVTDSAGHFRFSGLGASTYLLFVRKPAYVERVEGPFALGRGETKTLSLVMVAEKDAPPGKNTPQVLEYSDEPQFTVAGVADPSNVGGHGSNVTLPTKEALARETASLAKETSDSRGNAGAPAELPKVASEDFAGNWEAGRKLVQSGRPKDAEGVTVSPFDLNFAPVGQHFRVPGRPCFWPLRVYLTPRTQRMPFGFPLCVYGRLGVRERTPIHDHRLHL